MNLVQWRIMVMMLLPFWRHWFLTGQYLFLEFRSVVWLRSIWHYVILTLLGSLCCPAVHPEVQVVVHSLSMNGMHEALVYKTALMRKQQQQTRLGQRSGKKRIRVN